MSSSTLPTPRAFVTQLLNSLPDLAHHTNANPLSNAPESVKKQLLALQVLFPNEFLPALDLLDRRLITRFHIGIEEPAATANSDAAPAPHTHTETQLLSAADTATHPADAIYYVRSAQQRSSRFASSVDSTTSYEVRLRAWNCTCPAFAFAAFPPVLGDAGVPSRTPTDTTDAYRGEAEAWNFGGLSLGQDMPPVCKHLLACVLAEKCRGVFGECMVERKMGVELAAGWAAGWGDM